MRSIEKYQDDYLNNPFEDLFLKFRRNKIIDALNKYKAKNILEIGCGMEPLFLNLKNFESLTIVEPSIIFFDNAKELSEDDPNIKIYNDFFENISEAFLNKPFDFIVLSGLLHEVENPKVLLLQLKEICKKNTVVHINVPNAKSFHRLLAMEMHLIDSLYQKSDRNIRFQQHTIFDIDSLSELIHLTGFRIEESGSYFIKPFTHKQMQELMSSQIINDEVLSGLDKMIKYMPDLGAEIYAICNISNQ